MSTRVIVTASIGASGYSQAIAMLRDAANQLEADPGERRYSIEGPDGEEEGAVYVTTYEEDD